MDIQPLRVSGLDLHRELRAVAERIIEGRKAFEEHAGRRSTKPLQPVALDPRDALRLLDDLAAAETALAEHLSTCPTQKGAQS